MSDIHLAAARGNLSNAITRDNAAKLAGTIITATPCGTRWCLKSISPDGTIEYFGQFDSRVPALGIAVLMVAQGGGVVVP
jgi:hypothetical protein